MKPPTLHDRIRHDIEARIMSGAWPAGQRIPSELELMAQYGCSRMTVNKAVATLASAGLVERRKRAGSFVARPRVHSMVLDVPDLSTEIAARGQDYGFRVVDRRIAAPANAEEAALAGAGKGAPLLTVRGVHLADGAPLAWEHRLVSLSAVPEIAEEQFDAISPGGWLIRHIPWTRGENRISAVAASPDVARRLDLPAGAPCLLVERRTWRADAAITLVRQYFAGDRYELIARFSGAQG